MPKGFTFSGQPDFEDYLESHLVLAAKRRLWIRVITVLYGLGSLYFGALPVSEPRSIALAVVGLLLLIYGIVISPIQFRWRVRRLWDRYPRAHREIDVTVDSDGLKTQDDKGEPCHYDWSSFIGFKETKGLFLIYLSPLQPLYLPKRLMESDDIAGFRELLADVFRDSAG